MFGPLCEQKSVIFIFIHIIKLIRFQLTDLSTAGEWVHSRTDILVEFDERIKRW